VATERGYLVTIQLTSPSKNALNLVETTLVKNLVDRISPANALKEGKNYYVGRAMIVSAQPISSDTARLATIRANYDQKRVAMDRAQLEAGGGGGGGGGNIGRQPLQPDYRRGGGGGAVPDGRRSPGGFGRRATDAIPVNPGIGGAGEDADKALKEREREIFADPLYPKETILDDWELTVLVAVVLDPQAPKTVEGSQQASVDPAEDRRTGAVVRR
jgi:hypothetical protein